MEPGFEPWSGQAHGQSPGLSEHGLSRPSQEQAWGGACGGGSVGLPLGLSFSMGDRLTYRESNHQGAFSNWNILGLWDSEPHVDNSSHPQSPTVLRNTL